ncbi:MAG: hypothetical protein Ta2A_26740 [Treponemataceae bacterium]|nr:MAG: hypothetical protein Ta2A_26740 [Treponemataceae bacterium]
MLVVARRPCRAGWLWLSQREVLAAGVCYANSRRMKDMASSGYARSFSHVWFWLQKAAVMPLFALGATRITMFSRSENIVGTRMRR